MMDEDRVNNRSKYEGYNIDGDADNDGNEDLANNPFNVDGKNEGINIQQDRIDVDVLQRKNFDDFVISSYDPDADNSSNKDK